MGIFAILKPNMVITDVEKIFITVAQNSGHQAYVFCANRVSFDNKKIKGKTIVNGVLQEELFDFPNIIQNRLAVKKEDKDVYLKLAEMIPFTSNRLGTKQQVYAKMEKVDDFKEFLIEVVNINNFNDFFEFVKKHKKIIAKPSASNQGKGIYSVEVVGEIYKVRHLNESVEYTESELENFFANELKNGRNLDFSPFFVSETNLGQTTVFRLQIMRGAGGKWELIKFFPYVNLNGKSDITNGMQGALITTREQLFLEQYYPDSFEKINVEIKKLFKVFTQNFQKLYAARLDSLGLDLGISQDGKVAIYEVNAGPGIGFMAYPAACAQVKYYEWLSENAKMPCINNFLPLNLR